MQTKLSIELHHGKIVRREVANLVKHGKSFLSNLFELSVYSEASPGNINIHIHIARQRRKKQAGTGPSRRHHIQGSKIAKRLPSVKYSFTVLENRNFLKKNFRKNYIVKKMDRVARRSSLARAPGALKSHNAEKLKGGTLCGFSTSILSQNMKKLKKTKIFIFGKKSHNAEKKLKGGTLWDFSTSILSQNMKKLKKTKIFIFGKKFHNAEKN